MVQVIGQEGIWDVLGQGLGAGASQGINASLNQMLENKQINKLEKEFISRGLPAPLARLGAVATKGGQTEIFKYALDQFKRDQDPNIQAYQNQQQGPFEQPSSPVSQPSPTSQPQNRNPIGSSDMGLTPSERVGREKERYKTNLPIFQDTTNKLRKFNKNSNLINILEKIDESDKLPKGLERLNVDAEGNLKLPFLASPESQRFVKTINEFSEGAKDTYGARVTNFDLQQFLRRYPTLLNTKEGRRQIYEQMKVVDDINKEYYSTLRDVFKEAGGVRKIDADTAEAITEERSANKIAELSKKFEDIGKTPEEKFQVGQEFDKLPRASEMKGVTITLPSGQDIRSNGSKWIKVKK